MSEEDSEHESDAAFNLNFEGYDDSDSEYDDHEDEEHEEDDYDSDDDDQGVYT